ncbi:hypothetical protein CYLTODRAFT_495503 [Cylindrobasidium torrendii FP15055 ss-10]|uniref:Uncharacterized protein n=1 Tax=Cylindrobasidium torrendii FP15055 ss-10 TaxID=1314674 RepID=A0A0D7ARH4_9AGAR|nr:hypothetical protein CYLTODRAFT_495503 [Cylindrobasidium torrendii FP15055 ss-10]
MSSKRTADTAFSDASTGAGSPQLQLGPSQGSGGDAKRPWKKTSKWRQKAPATSDKPANHDRSRFDDIVNDLMPYSIPSCQTALTRVGNSLKITGSKRSTFPEVADGHYHYVMPEAAIFANHKHQHTRTLFLVNLVRLLPLIKCNIGTIKNAKDDMAHMTSGLWRKILAGFDGKGYKEGTLAAEMRTSAMEVFIENLKGHNLPPDLHKLSNAPAVWNGVTIVSANTPNADLEDLRTEICREVIWYCNEVNWRVELLQLDSFMYLPGPWDDYSLDPIQRRTSLIEGMHHWNSMLLPPDEAIGKDVGFASEDREERCVAALDLMDIMRLWTGGGAWCRIPERLIMLDKELSRMRVANQLMPSLEQILEFEDLLWDHYIRAFVFVFARAPTLPRAFCVDQFRG